jgi:hypothetical protein
VSQNPSLRGFGHWEVEHGKVFRLRNWKSPEKRSESSIRGGHVVKIEELPGFWIPGVRETRGLVSLGSQSPKD